MNIDLEEIKNPDYRLKYRKIIKGLRTQPNEIWTFGENVSFTYYFGGDTIQFDLVDGWKCYADYFGERIKIGFDAAFIHSELTRFINLARKKGE